MVEFDKPIPPPSLSSSSMGLLEFKRLINEKFQANLHVSRANLHVIFSTEYEWKFTHYIFCFYIHTATENSDAWRPIESIACVVIPGLFYPLQIIYEYH